MVVEVVHERAAQVSEDEPDYRPGWMDKTEI